MIRRAVPIERLAGLLPETRGLTAAEAAERRQRYGVNDIVETTSHPWLETLADTLRDPMLWFLAALGALYAVLGETAEALTLLAAIVPLAGMDAYLHFRTRASTEGLKGRLGARATVIRDGVTREIPAVDLVPGDLVLVSSGEPFPADGLVVSGADLQADESTLTGEAYPVPKRPLLGPIGAGAQPVVDARHWGFAGTRLLTGRASLRIVLTGGGTLYGEIVRSAVASSQVGTPLQRGLQRLVFGLLVAAVVICLVLAAVRLLQGHGWFDALISAVTLAAAALPEEFPVTFTFFLGVGVYRLARRQALVRRAVSVENIGRVTVICSDKTGTITEGSLHLAHLQPAEAGDHQQLLSLAALASRADSGDPMDIAIGREANSKDALPSATRLASFPFTESRRRETTVASDGDGGIVVATKGAIETALAMTVLPDAERREWNDRAAGLAAEGHKVIACVWQALDGSAWQGSEPEDGYRLAGLLAFEDPVRDGVTEAVQACRQAGIRPIMVTGDHPGTARAVAQEIGLGWTATAVITGDELEARTVGGGVVPREIEVVARATPAQKLILVRALQGAGEIVAVTGDGVNDVPALQAADIGIAMGERGTRSAREVADIVLLDDNFRTIVDAIAEGRQLFRNLRLSFQYLLAFHLPFVGSALVVPLAGYPLLYLPIHIVWLELILHATALLVFQELPTGGLRGGWPARTVRFFSAREWGLIGLVGMLVAAVVVGAYVMSVESGRGTEHGRAMALAALVTASAGLTAVSSGLRTTAARLVVAATLGSAILFVQTPGLAGVLHLRPLGLGDWVLVMAGSLLALAPLVIVRTIGRVGPETTTTTPAVPTLLDR